MVERVFRREESNQDKVLGKTDLDAMEKEISIDIAELKRDMKRVSTAINEKFTAIMNNMNPDNHREKSDAQTLTLDIEDNIAVRRNSSRYRKRSILNEASYLANRLSRALSNSNILTADEKQSPNTQSPKKREESSKKFIDLHIIEILFIHMVQL